MFFQVIAHIYFTKVKMTGLAVKEPSETVRKVDPLNVFSLQKVGTEFEIDSDLKTLQFYSIEDGDQVLVRWS